MTVGILFSGFHGWIETIFSSILTYIILALFFALLLAFMLYHFLKDKKGKKPILNNMVLSCSTPKACEEKLLNSIESLHGHSRIVLLAAAGLDCMPVTVPIHIAIISSEKKRRCLLIDLDTKRDAVWKVFHLNIGNSQSISTPAPSGIENLSVLPAHYFEQNKSSSTII